MSEKTITPQIHRAMKHDPCWIPVTDLNRMGFRAKHGKWPAGELKSLCGIVQCAEASHVEELPATDNDPIYVPEVIEQLLESVIAELKGNRFHALRQRLKLARKMNAAKIAADIDHYHVMEPNQRPQEENSE